jgi:hypothetical protein
MKTGDNAQLGRESWVVETAVRSYAPFSARAQNIATSAARNKDRRYDIDI